jgi:hypothetical protein
MPRYTMNISPTGTYPNAQSDQAGQVACLKPGDELSLAIANFGPNSTIATVKFFDSAPHKVQTQPFATWDGKSSAVNYSAGGTVTKLFSVERTSFGVNIKNSADAGSREQHVWFAVVITNTDKQEWVLDPEVINTGGGDSRAGFTSPQLGDADQTLA